MPAQHRRVGRRLIGLIHRQRVVGRAIFVIVIVHFRPVAGGAEIRQQPAVALPQQQAKPVVMVMLAAPRAVFDQHRLLVLRPTPQR